MTSPKVDLGDKTAYHPDRALACTRGHAEHFAHITRDVLERFGRNSSAPILTAPFDAELFGHWWFEGPEWLKNVALELAKPSSGVVLTTCGEYLDSHRPSGYLALPEGSWGRNGTHEVWLNPDTEWTWKHIYSSEQAVEHIVKGKQWKGNQLATRLAKQICRELLLLESSDWQFLITTQSARDYAEKRFLTHLEQLRALLEGWKQFESTKQIPQEVEHTLSAIEARDSIFPELQPELWSG